MSCGKRLKWDVCLYLVGDFGCALVYNCGCDGLDDCGVGHFSDGVDWFWFWHWDWEWLWDWHVNWERLWDRDWAWNWDWAWDWVGGRHQALAHYTNIDSLVKGKAGGGLSDEAEVAGEFPGGSKSSRKRAVAAEGTAKATEGASKASE